MHFFKYAILGLGLVSGLALAQTLRIYHHSGSNIDLSISSIDSIKTRVIEITPQIGTMTDPRDNRSYRTTTISRQTWMAQNLAYKSPIDSSNWYNGDSAKYGDYGRLYSWKAALAGKNPSTSGTIGICPSGWHLPSLGEWRSLLLHIDSIDGPTEIGGASLKTKAMVWQFDSATINHDRYQFTALPSGRYDSYDSYIKYKDINTFGYYWTSEYADSTFPTARAITFSYNSDGMGQVASHIEDRAAIRCIKD